MAESLSFSPLQAFVDILRKLSTEEFTRKKMERYGIIREQTRRLLESSELTAAVSSKLTKGIDFLLTDLPSVSSPSFQGSLWPKFHNFRVKDVPRIWKGVDADPILMQKVTLNYLLTILKTCSPSPEEGPTIEFEREQRRKSLTLEEHNAIRYVAGYVVGKLKKAYNTKGSIAICQCLLSMEEGNSLPEEVTDSESFKEYTCAWLNIINRGGLFNVNDEVYQFFMEVELSVYPLLRWQLDAHGEKKNKEELLRIIQQDENVLFSWMVITVDLSNDDSKILLRDIIQWWITIRGFSLASRFMEEYKEATKQTMRGKKSLRKELSQAAKKNEVSS